MAEDSLAGRVELSVHVADNWPTKPKLLCEIVQLPIWPLHGSVRLRIQCKDAGCLMKIVVVSFEVLILSARLPIDYIGRHVSVASMASEVPARLSL